MGDSFPSQSDVDHVLAVCPELDTDDVRRDLKFTRNVELTVNRALDGRFLRGVFDLLDVADQPSTAVQQTCDSDTDINSDDDLPTITLKPTASASTSSYAPTSRVEFSDSGSDSGHNIELTFPTKQDVTQKANSKYEVTESKRPKANVTSKHTLSSSSASKPSGYIAVEDDVISVESKSSPMEKSVFKRHPRDLSPSSSSSDDNLPTPPKKLPRKDSSPNVNAKLSAKASLCKNSTTSSSAVVTLSSTDSDSDSDCDQWRRPLSYRLNVSQATKPVPVDSYSSAKESSSDGMVSQRIAKPRAVTPQPIIATLDDGVGRETELEDGESGLTSNSERTDEFDSQGSKKKGKRRSPEEIQERKRQALLRRQEKELERQKKKEEREQEREAKKKLKDMEAAKKRAEREAIKSMKPGECVKNMTVVLDRCLAQSPSGGKILTQLNSLEAKTRIEDQPVPYSVTWRRAVTQHNFGGDIQLGSISTKQIEEEETLVYVPVADFVEQVYNYKQLQQGDSTVAQATLQSFVQKVKSIYQGKKVTLLVLGLEKYLRDQHTQRQRQFRDIVRNNGVMTEEDSKGKKRKKKETENSFSITRGDVEQALVHVQLWEDVVVKMLEDPEQVADIIRMYTKSVAETPFKRQRDESTFSFHIESSTVNSVKVDRDGRGLLKVWQRQIQQMRNVSPEMSAAVVAEFPSPQALLQAYERCSSEKEAQLLLKDIMVRRGAGVLATSRRIGPELSKRIHILLTSCDGEKLLQTA